MTVSRLEDKGNEWCRNGKNIKITEQQLCDQARAIRKNVWLSDLELENIQRIIEAENEIVNEIIQDVEKNQTERDIVRTSERNKQIVNDLDETINNVAVNVEILEEELQLGIAQLNKILAGRRNTDSIFFKKS